MLNGPKSQWIESRYPWGWELLNIVKFVLAHVLFSPVLKSAIGLHLTYILVSQISEHPSSVVTFKIAVCICWQFIWLKIKFVTAKLESEFIEYCPNPLSDHKTESIVEVPPSLDDIDDNSVASPSHTVSDVIIAVGLHATSI